MRTSRHRDYALPALPLARVVEDGYGSWRLHDSTVPAKIGQQSAHAALRHAAVLRTVIPIDASRVVERRHFCPFR